MAFNIDAVNKGKQEEGVWADYEGSDLCIAWGRNTKFVKALNRLRKPYQRQLDKGTLDPETADSILCEALAEAVLIDWKGVIDGSGDEVPYSKELAKEALIGNSELREFVAEYSSILENYKNEEIKEKAKK